MTGLSLSPLLSTPPDATLVGGKKNNKNKRGGMAELGAAFGNMMVGAETATMAGGKKTDEKVLYKGGNYTVHKGPRGGKYINHKGQKVYI